MDLKVIYTKNVLAGIKLTIYTSNIKIALFYWLSGDFKKFFKFWKYF